MTVFLLLLATLQLPQPAQLVRTRTFQIMAPQGWVVVTTSGAILLNHASGASVFVNKSSQTENLKSYARRSAERIMAPLGFAKLQEPRHFAGNGQEWVQYEIRGNRLSDRRRILYRALMRKGGMVEFIYENSEERFDLLMTEAQAIASSLQDLPEGLPGGRRARTNGVR